MGILVSITISYVHRALQVDFLLRQLLADIASGCLWAVHIYLYPYFGLFVLRGAAYGLLDDHRWREDLQIDLIALFRDAR